MKILYLTPGCFDKGGISRYSRYQIAALRQIVGPENLRALSLLGPSDGDIETPFAVRWAGPPDRGATKASRLAFAGRALTEALAWKPDIVWSAHVNFGPLLGAAAVVASARSVLNVYGLEIWSGLSERRRRLMGRVGTVVADCHFTADYVRETGLHAARPTVIWDPVDLDRFQPGPAEAAVIARYGLPDPLQSFVVMSLGRLAKAAAHKGYDRLIEAVAQLAPAHPDLRLAIAGRGDDRPRLEALAADLGIADRVVFTGPVDEADLPAIYRCAQVFSLVSDRGLGRGEGIPLTPLEAMACGTPIVVGDEDGSREAVVAQRNGLVVSPRDLEAHVRALASLIQDRALRLRMATGAREVAQAHFGYDRFVDEHRSLLAGLKIDHPIFDDAPPPAGD